MAASTQGTAVVEEGEVEEDGGIGVPYYLFHF